jgi:hypothetical protein
MTEDPKTPIIDVAPDGSAPADAAPEPGDATGVNDLIEHPAKVIRIGMMIKQLLEEVRAAPLDDLSRNRLKEIHEASITELSEGLSPDLRDELARLTLPFEAGTPTDAELRIAHAQLVGWLDGLFHGLQTALAAQQMAARAQLEELSRRALPPGVGGPRPESTPNTGGPYL